MKIQLKNWIVNNLRLDAKSDKQLDSNDAVNEQNKYQFQFTYGSSVSSNQHNFQIAFKVKLDNIRYVLDAEIIYNFIADEDLPKDFKDSDFIKINAPAIAFPYLRSYITMLTMQSGFGSVILPSINFVMLARKK